MTRTLFRLKTTAICCVTLMSFSAWGQKVDNGTRLKNAESDIEQLRSDLAELTGNKTAKDAKERLDRMTDDVSVLRRAIAQSVLEKDAAQAEAKRLQTETDRLAAEVSALRKTVAEISVEVDTLKKFPTSGYDRGFFVQSRDGHVQLRINGFVRPRYTLALMRQYNTDKVGNLAPSPDGKADQERMVKANDFEIETARIETALSLFEKLHGVLSLDFGSFSGEMQPPVNRHMMKDTDVADLYPNDRAVHFIDAFGEYRVMDKLVFRAGQFKVPFDLETGFDDRSLVFSSRSLMTRRYFVYGDDPAMDTTDEMYRKAFDLYRGASFGRDLGIDIGGTALKEHLCYRLGIFNGAGMNGENDNRDVLFAGRISVSPLGALSPKMSDFEITPSPRFSIGLGAAYDLPAHNPPSAAVTKYNSSDISATLDVLIKWRGLSAFASVFYRRSDHGFGLSDEKEILDSLGTAVQTAYYIPAFRLEPALRYSFYTARLNRDKDAAHEGTAALSYFVVADHLKVGIEYRGIFPVDKDASYLSPLGVRHDILHEISLSAEVAF